MSFVWSPKVLCLLFGARGFDVFSLELGVFMSLVWNPEFDVFVLKPGD